jgi:hypothetical protein
MVIPKIPKIPKTFFCENCKYTTSNKKDFNKHNMTAKHRMIINDTEMVTIKCKPPVSFICECGKSYKFSSGLSRHKQTCIPQPVYNENTIISNEEDHLQEENTELKSMVKELLQHSSDNQTQSLQSNQEFQQMMLDMFKECMQNMSTNTHIKTQNNTNTNSNNTNNIHYYLNVTCKDAETDLDFLEQWKENCIELFHDKKELMGERKINYGRLCTELFLKQIKSKPQIERFVQTNNWKDGKTYVNTAELDDDNQPTGESQFVHHTDGLESVTNIMSHALGKTILDCANQEVKDKYFEENRSINITSRAPTTPDMERKRYMSAGIMMATSEAFSSTCSGAERTQIMKVTTKGT